MKALYTLLISSVLLSLTYITPSRYVVQVAAYGTPVPLSHFEQFGLDNVYRQSDQNKIYRYYIGEFEVRDSADAVLRRVTAKGFKFARIIDLEQQRSLCGTPCPEMESRVTTFADLKEEHPYLKTIYFDYDVSKLRPVSKLILDSVAVVLKEHPEYNVFITGHTDSKGDAVYNELLSRRRAKATRIYLVNSGIKFTRIITQVYGEGMPISRNIDRRGKDSPVGRQYNRRVVIAIVTKEGELVSNYSINEGEYKGNIEVVPDSLRVYENHVKSKNMKYSNQEKQGR